MVADTQVVEPGGVGLLDECPQRPGSLLERGSGGRIPTRGAVVTAAVPWEAQHSFGDDVALDLVRAAVDGLGPGVEEDALERVELVAVADDHRVGAEEIHHRLPEIAVPAATRTTSTDRGFRSEGAVAHEAGEHPRVVVPVELEADPGAASRCRTTGSVVRPARPERDHEVVQLLLECGLVGEHGGPRSVPTVPITTDHAPSTGPTTRSAAVRASEKNTSANSAPSARLRIGRTSTPGWSAGTRINDSPGASARRGPCGTARRASRRASRRSSRSSGR